MFAVFLHKSHICEKSDSWDMGQNALGQSDYRIFKSTISLEQNDEKAWFYACRHRFMKIRSWLKNIVVCVVKNGYGHSVLRSLILVKMDEALEIIGLLNQVYLTNDLMSWADWQSNFCVLITMEWFLVWPTIYPVSLTFIFYWLFPYGSQSSQIIKKNVILKFLKNMIKPQPWSILFIRPSAYVSKTHFSRDVLNFCMRIFCRIY